MIVRTAVLEGTVAEGLQATFDKQMRERVLPAISCYPGIRRVMLRRTVAHEVGAPAIYMLFDLYFDTREAMHTALASPVRQEVRTLIGEAMAVFQGRVYHFVSEEIPEAGVPS